MAWAILSATSACSNVGKFVWVAQYAEPPAPQDPPYTLAVGDIIQVRVFNQDQLSARVRVRPDGKITLPLLNEMVAAGLSPLALSRILEDHLKDLVKNRMRSFMEFSELAEVVRKRWIARIVGCGGPQPNMSNEAPVGWRDRLNQRRAAGCCCPVC